MCTPETLLDPCKLFLKIDLGPVLKSWVLLSESQILSYKKVYSKWYVFLAAIVNVVKFYDVLTFTAIHCLNTLL